MGAVTSKGGRASAIVVPKASYIEVDSVVSFKTENRDIKESASASKYAHSIEDTLDDDIHAKSFIARSEQKHKALYTSGPVLAIPDKAPNLVDSNRVHGSAPSKVTSSMGNSVMCLIGSAKPSEHPSSDSQGDSMCLIGSGKSSDAVSVVAGRHSPIMASSVEDRKFSAHQVSTSTQTEEHVLEDSHLADGSLHSSSPQMPKSWRKGDALGSGSFGTVFLGLNNDTGELLAVKEVSLTVEDAKRKEAITQIEQEVALLSTLHHPNIVHYSGTLKENGSLFIFLEYVPGGSIASLLHRFGPLQESVIRIYTRQILSGLTYLHSLRTVHRDIKGANLLVEKDGRIKLADFGMAKQMVEQASFTKSFKGSAFWMAPEVIKQQGHGVAADIWSVGCTVLEMATGKPPWNQCATQVQVIFRIASSQELPAIPETLSPAASEFVLLCLQRDPALRPSAEQLLAHPFVRDVTEPNAVNCTAGFSGRHAASAVPTVKLGNVRGHASPSSEFKNQNLVPARRQQASLSDGGGGGLGSREAASGMPGSHLQAASTAAGAAIAAAPYQRRLGMPGGLCRISENSPHTTGTTLQQQPQYDMTVQQEVDLADLVLGRSNTAATKQHVAVSGGGLASTNGNASYVPAVPLTSSPAAPDRSGGTRTAVHSVDFSTQPQLLKVRGLLDLPPMRMLSGESALPLMKSDAARNGDSATHKL
ncbi:hypothetical protein CEUSTIGMA_g3343.t1 [Chlamydomonas eustigma]|uniref:mitogen-activated protein kinase kinase kinase n=1 Tax=Chlamydomonas eustigma TaxID=1157962 RepID=A0A250WZG5_9CHLO|nr:hypothetical protein CEUSTIGMA_g3343.t1 [Chlamydomonas eustigma]|eukprot:GAX75900.1 hypothetical protein CEUSTIGMA_g3343.t1 [Chlamydomonas eustigma]